MVSPFGQFYAMSANPFYRFSAINFDTYHTDFSNRMNLFWNQKMSELDYRSTHFFVPNMNYGVITPYSYNTNPFADIYNAAMTMFHNQSLQSGGPGLLDANGNLNLARQLFGAGVMGNMAGYMPGMVNPGIISGGNTGGNQEVNQDNNPGNNNNDDQATIDKKNREIRALKDLFTTYKAVAKNLDEETISSIDKAMNNSGSLDERLKALQDMYNSLDKTAIKKTIPYMHYQEELIQAGYNFENTDYSYYRANDVEDLVKNAIDDLKKPVGDDSTIGSGITALTSSVSLNLSQDDTNDILRIISIWNDKKKGETIVGALAKYVSENGNPTSRQSNIETHVKPFIDALQKEVTFYKERAVNGNNIEDLEKFSTKLGEAYDNVYQNPSEYNIGKMNKYFNQLYVLLRKCEANRINDLVEKKYSFLNDISTTDTDFVDDVIIKATEADLVAEGLANIDVRFREEADGENLEADLKALCTGETPYLKELISGERKFYVSYETKKVYELVDGKLRQVKNATIGNSTMSVPTKTEYEEGSVDLDSIQDEIDAVREKRERAEQAENEGDKIARDTNGKYKAPVDSTQVAAYTATELAYIIPAYNNNEDTQKTRDGYFETMMENNILKKADVLAQVKSLLKNAEQLQLTELDAYKKLEAIAKRYSENGSLENAPDMNGRNKTERNWWNYNDKQAAVLSSVASGAVVGTFGGPVGVLIGAAVGFFGGLTIGKVSDIEVIDDCVQELCKEIKEKQKSTFI